MYNTAVAYPEGADYNPPKNVRKMLNVLSVL